MPRSGEYSSGSIGSCFDSGFSDCCGSDATSLLRVSSMTGSLSAGIFFSSTLGVVGSACRYAGISFWNHGSC